MNILVIGSGAREHALIKALHRSPQRPSLFCYGTAINPGIHHLTEHYAAGDITDCAAVVSRAKLWGIELAIIGPEAPLNKAWLMHYGRQEFQPSDRKKNWHKLKPLKSLPVI